MYEDSCGCLDLYVYAHLCKNGILFNIFMFCSDLGYFAKDENQKLLIMGSRLLNVQAEKKNEFRPVIFYDVVTCP